MITQMISNLSAFIEKVKKKSLRELVAAILRRLFYTYPLLLITPFFYLLLFFSIRLLAPWKKIIIGNLVTERIGHLGTNTDLFLRKQQLNSTDHTYLFFAGNPCNHQLLMMWKRHLHIIESPILHDLMLNSRRWWEKTSHYEPLVTNFNEYEIYQATQPTLEFTVQDEESGQALLKQMGIDLDQDWFVCIFARDIQYLNTVYPKGDWSYHYYRNADIENFKLVSEYITTLGGYVLRIGSHVEKPFDLPNPKIIDYASHFQTDFLDIFVISKCRIVLGSPSGICDIAMAFDVPYLGINTSLIGNAPHGKNGLFIPKKVKSRHNHHYIPFSQIIQETRNCEVGKLIEKWWQKAGYEFEENTPEEILDVTKEMIRRLDGSFSLSEEDTRLLEKYFELYPEDHWTKEIKNPIGIEFLKKNQLLFL